MSKMRRYMLTLTSLAILMAPMIFSVQALAAPCTQNNPPTPAGCTPTTLFPEPKGIPKATADQSKIQTVVNIAFSIFGAVALLIISIAGFRFVIHQGEPAEMTKQRNSIIYAVIGLAVTLSAWAIVSFVIGKL